MKRTFKYIFGIAALLVLLILSLDIRKLDKHLAAQTSDTFDAGEYAARVWEQEIPGVILEASEIGYLVDMLSNEPESIFETRGRKLGISSTWYFMVRGSGIIDSVEEEYLLVRVDGIQVELATAFIFGNAIRDGSGVVDIDEFVNMTDFNNVSIALNQRVKEEVIPELLKVARPGMNLEFAGAVEISEEHIKTNPIRVIPVSVIFADAIQ